MPAFRRTALVQALCLGAALTAGLATASPAAAAQIDVPCDTNRLVAAIGTANSQPGPDTLVLAPGCTYELDKPLPGIRSDITVEADNSTLTRQATVPFRILTVESGRLDLRDAFVTNGDAGGSFGGGIAVFSGILEVTDSTVRDNRATFSGGIGGLEGTSITVNRSNIMNNLAERNGGGLISDGVMTVLRSRVVGNRAVAGAGGGIANSGVLRVERSNVNENTAYQGGGIANLRVGSNPNPTVTLDSSNVNNNTATVMPGGVYNQGGSVEVLASRINGNHPTNCLGTISPIPGCEN
ncbi:MAG TPA: hypothetical protein VFY14_20210 [Streptomyces sp.]|nr:hypothetical protein [Streptomyces sp.]